MPSTLPIFGFLTELVDIHFPEGPTGATGPHIPTYPSFFLYNPLQLTISAVPRTPAYFFTPNPDGMGGFSTFRGYELQTGRQIGFATFADAFRHVGAVYGPFTQGYATQLAVTFNTYQANVFNYFTNFASIQSDTDNSVWVAPIARYVQPGGPIIVPPTKSAHGWNVGQIVPGYGGDIGNATMGDPPEELIVELVYLQSGLGVLPQGASLWTVGGPVPYQSSSPPYDGT